MAVPTHHLFTDGGARGNPGPAGFGVVLQTADGRLVEEVARAIGWATNNVAEYEGLIEGLRTALRNGVERLAVFMDSTLVVQQMRGAFKVKNPGLKPLHATAEQLASQFHSIEFQAIPRERNKHADRLSNEGMDACRDAEPSSPQAGQQTLL
ncbi:MAG: reverse transcriptase-like protein [Actinobacteria bacterium]|nr:reverse transcriptase-like protein [Actinomycetota bacterium]